MGELGLKFVDDQEGIDLDKQKLEVSYIDPQGPAAKTGIQVGDVVTSVDGIDCTGASSSDAWTMLRAPPGTTLKLGLARGVTIALVLGAPRPASAQVPESWRDSLVFHTFSIAAIDPRTGDIVYSAVIEEQVDVGLMRFGGSGAVGRLAP